MKVGDLVTLSASLLTTNPMWRWQHRAWREKKPCVGLVTKIREAPWISEEMSDNQKVYYYVKWIGEGPAGRWGAAPFNAASYFFRKDLKHFK